MIAGIGTDIVAIARIETALQRHGKRFAERILSQLELIDYIEQNDSARFLSKRFAAKEALAKATGYGLRHPVSLQQISVSHDELGKPIFVFGAELNQFLQQRGITRSHLSLSDEREFALAFVVLETGI